MGTADGKQFQEKTEIIGFPAAAGKMTECADLVKHLWSKLTVCLCMGHISNVFTTAHFPLSLWLWDRKCHFPRRRWCVGVISY